jgi:multidrug efflux pump subunit AcrA (membrane-fusion protein)
MRRTTTLGIGIAAVVAASAVGWLAGRQIRSPAEVAARTAAPEPSLIAVPVEERSLSSEVVIRGTVRYGSPQAVSLPTSALKPGRSIITTAPTRGAQLDEGTVALTVSGRPVFVLDGAQPMYRDLGPGTTGADVQQLEEALVRLGYDPGPLDGVYDGATQLAVAQWYLASGFAPFGPTDDQLAALRSAQADRFGAQSDLLAARDSLASARSALIVAQTQADAAHAAMQGAPAVEASAQARADQERKAAQAEVTNKESALQSANDALATAQAELAAAQKAKPKPTPEELAALQAAVREATSAVTVAQADLTAAQAALAAVEVPVPGAASAELLRAVAAADAELVQAQQAVSLAQRQVSLLNARSGDTGTAVVEMTGRLGVQVPADEVLFFPTLPVRVDDVTVKVGDEPSGPIMTVSNLQLAVDAALSTNDAKLVRLGAPVAIEEPDLGIKATGEVTQVADSPGTNGVDPQRFYLEVTPADAPAALVGASVVLTITVDSTEGDVLAVPVAALSVAADGSSRVQVQDEDGATHYVTVTPGLAAKGLVAVTPAGPLAAGDLVVVGRGPSTGATGAGPSDSLAPLDTGTAGTPTSDLSPGSSAPADSIGGTNAP